MPIAPRTTRRRGLLLAAVLALAAGYALTGPILMLKGEEMAKKVPVLRPVPAAHEEKPAQQEPADRFDTPA